MTYVSIGQKRDFSASGDGLWVLRGGSKGGECLDWERRVRLWAGLDERCGEREDLIEGQRDIEG